MKRFAPLVLVLVAANTYAADNSDVIDGIIQEHFGVSSSQSCLVEKLKESWLNLDAFLIDVGEQDGRSGTSLKKILGQKFDEPQIPFLAEDIVTAIFGTHTVISYNNNEELRLNSYRQFGYAVQPLLKDISERLRQVGFLLNKKVGLIAFLTDDL